MRPRDGTGGWRSRRPVRSGGRAAAFDGLSAEWSSVLPGIEARAAATQWSVGESGATDTTVTIRVHLKACPALIEVDRIWSYYSEHHNEFEATHYAVSMVGGRKPLIVTAVHFGKKLVVGCPWCTRQSSLKKEWRGAEIACPECKGPLKVNEFLVGRMA